MIGMFSDWLVKRRENRRYTLRYVGFKGQTYWINPDDVLVLKVSNEDGVEITARFDWDGRTLRLVFPMRHIGH